MHHIGEILDQSHEQQVVHVPVMFETENYHLKSTEKPSCLRILVQVDPQFEISKKRNLAECATRKKNS